jgi:very-short-patch-repair endonuclease
VTDEATDYLIEVSLGRFLRERVDSEVIASQVVPGLGRRYRPDFRSELHRLIVEFDGDEHYRSAKKILGDQERDAAFAAAG